MNDDSDLGRPWPATDALIRAMTADGSFRVMAVRTTDTVTAIAAAQDARGDTAERLGELITGAVLIREATVPERRVQLIYVDPAGGRLIADSHPDGTSRGLVNPGSDAAVDVNADAQLRVVYTLATDELHQGVIAAPRAGGISGALMAYMHDSEQVITTIAVAATGAEGREPEDGAGAIRAAGGYLVQLLPDAGHDALARLTRRLESAPPVADVLRGPDTTATATATADDILAAVLGDVPHDVLERRAQRFGCQCSRDRMLAGLAALPAADVHELAGADEPLELRCDACGQRYTITPDAIRGLVASARPSASRTPRNGSPGA